VSASSVASEALLCVTPRLTSVKIHPRMWKLGAKRDSPILRLESVEALYECGKRFQHNLRKVTSEKIRFCLLSQILQPKYFSRAEVISGAPIRSTHPVPLHSVSRNIRIFELLSSVIFNYILARNSYREIEWGNSL
jgi:hypothetical protein